MCLVLLNKLFFREMKMFLWRIKKQNSVLFNMENYPSIHIDYHK